MPPTMSKVIMGNGDFMVAVILRGGSRETAQRRVLLLSRSLWLNRLEPQSSKTNFLLPIMSIDTVVYTFTLSWDNLCRRNSCVC